MFNPYLLSSYDFSLPSELIAQTPVSPRDRARLLHVDGTGRMKDLIFKDLENLLRPDDILVINETRVIFSRFWATRSGGMKVRVDLGGLVPHSNPMLWQGFIRGGRKIQQGNKLRCSSGAGDFDLLVVRKGAYGDFDFLPKVDEASFYHFLDSTGQLPLPPYIRRPEGSDPLDRERYQTVYAKRPGALAAPTAGLHFTEELMNRLKDLGITFVSILLHVGAGTFLPVRSEKIYDHVMHYEWGALGASEAHFLRQAKAAGRRIICVGTTSLRLLESAAQSGKIQAFDAFTNIFIYPGYAFKAADGLITNFHLPKSTLFMLVSAFSGLETMHHAYHHAIDSEYRFFSYGDACFLEKTQEYYKFIENKSYRP